MRAPLGMPVVHVVAGEAEDLVGAQQTPDHRGRAAAEITDGVALARSRPRTRRARPGIAARLLVLGGFGAGGRADLLVDVGFRAVGRAGHGPAA